MVVLQSRRQQRPWKAASVSDLEVLICGSWKKSWEVGIQPPIFRYLPRKIPPAARELNCLRFPWWDSVGRYRKIHPWNRRNINPTHQLLGSMLGFGGVEGKHHDFGEDRGIQIKDLCQSWVLAWYLTAKLIEVKRKSSGASNQIICREMSIGP